MGKLKNFDVVVIGRSCLDYIAIVDQFPRENQKVPFSFRLTEGGGQGGTASCCVSTLGGKVAYVAKLGDDPEGRVCLKRLSKRVHGNLIVTNGEDGAYYLVEGSLYHVTVPNAHAVDTIGAGDNFHAAFAFALTKGFDLHQAVSFSVAVASLSCREYGGRKGVPMMNAALKVANELAVKIVG